MLTITIPAIEMYDDHKQEFVSTKSYTLQLEHSLVAISKWESKWNIPFLSKGDKTLEETIDYIECMTITKNVDRSVYKDIPNSILKEISEYINSPMTATTIAKSTIKGGSGEIMTAEVIYYYMVALQIPFECQKWHLNRLLTLITVCNIKNAPPKKMGKKEVMNRNKELNAARKNKMNTSG